MAVWAGYRAQLYGPDLHDDQATDWTLPLFDALLWRRGAVHLLEVGPAGHPQALGRLVEIDFRNRCARLEYWHLGADNGAGEGRRLLDVLVRHAFENIGLHRVGALVPAYLAGAGYDRLSELLDPEGTLVSHLFRRGRMWDVRALGRLEQSHPEP